jgi:predicted DNA-binding transcriptional regulator YafY
MGSWVLLAWCRLRQGWRRFFLSRIQEVDVLDQPFSPRPAAAWRHLVASGFGVFQGDELQKVVIRFSPHASRWVREQLWHPDQEMEDTPGGGLILTVPVADLREIKMKVMQYGPEAEVLEPAELRGQIRKDAEAAAALYR